MEEKHSQPNPRVARLLERIKQNQQIQARFHDYEFQLLACRRLPELLDRLIDGAVRHFDLTAVSLALHDPHGNVASALEHLGLTNFDGRLQLCPKPDLFHSLFPASPGVRLGPLSDRVRQAIFPGQEGIGSAALLPLMRQEKLIGSLHFASHSAQRYSADMGTNFMWHLASMVAICLENCLALEQLQRQGQEDILTQVRNRRCFDEEFGKELERAARQREPLSCLFADIDYFKQINDAYGHQFGDRCLRQVAQQIARELRKTDLLARYGGEEFVALLPSCPPRMAIITAERVRQAVANRPLRLPEGEVIPLSISVGLATWEPGAGRAELASVGDALLRCADQAMYTAKQEGRNRVCVGSFRVD
jgi:two-component system cell cycle response regulator